MASQDIFGILFGRIDDLGTNMIQTLYTSISSSLGPVFTTGATIFVVWWGYELLTGAAGVTGKDFLWRCGRLALIYALAFSWGDFSAYVVQWIVATPNDLATIICESTGGPSCGSTSSSMSQALTDIWTAANQASANVAAAGGWVGVGLMIAGYIILIIVGIMLAVATAMLMLGKMALFLLLATAPIFICFALFRVTSGMFNGWLTSLFQYGVVLPVVVYGILGVLMIVLKQSVDDLTASIGDGSGDLDFTVVTPFLLMCGVSTYLLLQAPLISAGIAGGARIESDRMINRLRRGTGAFASGAVRAAGYGVGAAAAARETIAARSAATEAAIRAARGAS